MIYVDRELSQKLERAEARANAGFVETRARLAPDSGACWIEVGGAYAMFDGVESPCTQTFGLGLFDEIGGEHFDRLEAFFIERGAPVFHEVSPMADPALMSTLVERAYRPIELTSVMYREIASDDLPASLNSDITSRVVTDDEVETWARTSANGWATEHESLADFMFNFGQVSAQCAGSYPWLAEVDGSPVATGMMFVHEDVAVLAGASTVPEARNRGAQNALLAARLTFAAERGCKLALMGASPGSQSQKNAQKNGFNIAYTRTKWQLMS